MKRDISGWILAGLLYGFCIAGCKTTKHIQKDKQSVVEVKKLDSSQMETTTKATVENTEEKYKKDLDTVIVPEKVKGKATVKVKSADTTAIYDSLGNKLGIVASSFDSIQNALNLTFTVQPPPVHAIVHEEGSKKSNKQTTEDTHKESALHSQSSSEQQSEHLNKDVVRKTDVWAWAKWIAWVLAVLALVLNYKRIWAWLLTKIKK